MTRVGVVLPMAPKSGGLGKSRDESVDYVSEGIVFSERNYAAAIDFDF